MAKIDTLEFTIGGKDYKSNVNVTKTGLFRVELNWQVVEALGLKSGPQEGYSKDGVVNPILTAYHAYLESKKELSLWISIKLEANGDFVKDEDGKHYIGHITNRKFHKQGFSSIASELAFGYEVYCLEKTSTGIEIWHNAEKVKSVHDRILEHDSTEIINGYMVGSVAYGVDKGTLIPCSDAAVDTLEKAVKGIASITKILYDFLNQDTDLIEAKLNKGNLLNS